MYTLNTGADGLVYLDINIPSGTFGARPVMVNVTNAYFGNLLSYTYLYDSSTATLVKLALKFAQQATSITTRLCICVSAPPV